VIDLDCVVVGGGPAGLSAALVLGRCRRRVVVIDAGRPRNRRSRASHGFFTRDGTSPADMLRIGREQLVEYGVPVVDDEAIAVRRDGPAFVVETKGGGAYRTRKLLLATGMTDVLPDVPGVDELFGKSVFVCPYCDGWENRDRRFGVWTTEDGAAKALGLLTWTRDLVVFTNGRAMRPADRERLARRSVRLVEDRVAALERDGERLFAVRLAGGERVERDALFVELGERQAAPFAIELGCAVTDNGTVGAGDGERKRVPGVWIAGDASVDMQVVAVAVAEGFKAACAINVELREETFG
jgi:thioredoxin reductase